MTDQTKKSQKDLILAHIEKHGSITPRAALQLYSCQRLAARISELRGDGYNIETELIVVPTRHGGKARVARYWMAA